MRFMVLACLVTQCFGMDACLKLYQLAGEKQVVIQECKVCAKKNIDIRAKMTVKTKARYQDLRSFWEALLSNDYCLGEHMMIRGYEDDLYCVMDVLWLFDSP